MKPPFKPSPAYVAAWHASRHADDASRDAANRLHSIRETVAAELGIPARAAMGLTPDAVKADPRWQQARRESERAMAASHAAGAKLTREHAAEYKAHRRAWGSPVKLPAPETLAAVNESA